MRVLNAQPAVVLRSAKFQLQQLSTRVQVSTQPTTVQDRAQAASRTAVRRVAQAIRRTRIHQVQTHHLLLPTLRRPPRRLPTAVAERVTRTAPEATLTKAPAENACRNSTGQPSICQRLW